MSELIYIDTNVWISLFKEEKDHLRPISDFSFELFRKALNCEYDILISSWLLKEIETVGYFKQTNEVCNQFKSKNKLFWIKVDGDDYTSARKCKHWQDRLHEILAKKGGATYLVTRNMNDFKGDLVETKFPENL